MIAFPSLNPVAFSLGPVVVRWYALAYMAGFIFGWVVCLHLAKNVMKHPPLSMTIEVAFDPKETESLKKYLGNRQALPVTLKGEMTDSANACRLVIEPVKAPSDKTEAPEVKEAYELEFDQENARAFHAYLNDKTGRASFAVKLKIPGIENSCELIAEPAQASSAP